MIWDVAAGVLVVAALFLLVRPSGDGPAMVSAFSGGLADIVTFAVAS